MDANLRLTREAILDAIVQATQGHEPEDAQTTAEIAEQAGVGHTLVTKALRAFHAQGRLRVYQVLRPGLDGRKRPVPAYVVLPPR